LVLTRSRERPGSESLRLNFSQARVKRGLGEQGHAEDAGFPGSEVSDWRETVQQSGEDRHQRPLCAAPRSPHDAHHPLTATDNLDRVFTLQWTRTLSTNLTLFSTYGGALDIWARVVGAP